MLNVAGRLPASVSFTTIFVLYLSPAFFFPFSAMYDFLSQLLDHNNFSTNSNFSLVFLSLILGFLVFSSVKGNFMASRQGLKPKRTSPRPVAALTNNSPTSSTTSSSRQFLEPSMDDLSSPASSSARSKPHHFHTENLSLDVGRSKENVTVTVRFRPLR